MRKIQDQRPHHPLTPACGRQAYPLANKKGEGKRKLRINQYYQKYNVMTMRMFHPFDNSKKKR
jgi:hypothetical protein